MVEGNILDNFFTWCGLASSFLVKNTWTKDSGSRDGGLLYLEDAASQVPHDLWWFCFMIWIIVQQIFLSFFQHSWSIIIKKKQKTVTSGPNNLLLHSTWSTLLNPVKWDSFDKLICYFRKFSLLVLSSEQMKHNSACHYNIAGFVLFQETL